MNRTDNWIEHFRNDYVVQAKWGTFLVWPGCSSPLLLEPCPENCTLSPLQALNPYSQDWALKAKISRKFAQNFHVGKDGQEYSRFVVHLVDEQVSELHQLSNQVSQSSTYSCGKHYPVLL